MKRNLALTFMFLPFIGFGQHELRANFDGGASWFSGSGASKTSFLISAFEDSYTNSPLGSLPGPSYGAAVNYKYAGSFLFFGMTVGYDYLQTKTGLTFISEYGVSTPIDGRTILSGSFVRFTPSLGLRIPFKNRSLDLGVGLDFQPLISSGMEEHITYTVEGTGEHFEDNRNRDNYIQLDLRPRIQADLNLGSLGFYTAYSLGVLNYYGQMEGSNAVAAMQTLKFGIAYKIL